MLIVCGFNICTSGNSGNLMYQVLKCVMVRHFWGEINPNGLGVCVQS